METALAGSILGHLRQNILEESTEMEKMDGF